MKIPRVNTTILMDWRTLMAYLHATGWQCRSVRRELPLVRTGLMCPVPVIVEESVQRRTVKWMRDL
jgi:hypothetical protein